jgi:hypothetical protein
VVDRLLGPAGGILVLKMYKRMHSRGGGGFDIHTHLAESQVKHKLVTRRRVLDQKAEVWCSYVIVVVPAGQYPTSWQSQRACRQDFHLNDIR